MLRHRQQINHRNPLLIALIPHDAIDIREDLLPDHPAIDEVIHRALRDIGTQQYILRIREAPVELEYIVESLLGPAEQHLRQQTFCHLPLPVGLQLLSTQQNRQHIPGQAVVMLHQIVQDRLILRAERKQIVAEIHELRGTHMTFLDDETSYQLLEVRTIQSTLTARQQQAIGFLEHIQPDQCPKQHLLLTVVELLLRNLREELLLLRIQLRIRVPCLLIMIAQDHVQQIGAVRFGEWHLANHRFEQPELLRTLDAISCDAPCPGKLQHRLLRHHLEAALLELRFLHDPGLLIRDIRVTVAVRILEQQHTVLEEQRNIRTPLLQRVELLPIKLQVAHDDIAHARVAGRHAIGAKDRRQYRTDPFVHHIHENHTLIQHTQALVEGRLQQLIDRELLNLLLEALIDILLRAEVHHDVIEQRQLHILRDIVLISEVEIDLAWQTALVALRHRIHIVLIQPGDL